MGHVTVVGGCRAKAPAPGVLASSLAVGSTVKLIEGGTAVEYLVVNQGIPSNSNLYDASCDGTWLLRKDIYALQYWDYTVTSEYNNDYENSEIHAYLNETFLGLFNEDTRTIIKQVKIPYKGGTGSSSTPVQSGANGLPSKVFLLSIHEVGLFDVHSPVDGAEIPYFSSDSYRIAYLNSTARGWWLRSANTSNAVNVWIVFENGSKQDVNATSNYYGVRPALILPSTAKFDSTTLILKG